MKNKKEFSKTIFVYTMFIYIVTMITAFIFSWLNKDTTIFIYLIPSTGGMFITSTAFYYNKAKMENLLKIKKDLIRFESEFSNPNIEEKIDDIDNIIEDKLNDEFIESISADIEIQSNME